MSNQREMVLEGELYVIDKAIVAITRAIDELYESDRFPDLDTKGAIFKLKAICQDLEDQYMLIEDELRQIEA